MLKTGNCVFCGHKATSWSGIVLARENNGDLNHLALEVMKFVKRQHIIF